MNLFNYIKYQGIDLSDLDELKSLPLELLEKYWMASTVSLDLNTNQTQEYKCRKLMHWYNWESFRSEQIEAYTIALKEYCNEPV